MKKRKYYAMQWELLFVQTKSGRRFAKYFSFEDRNSRDTWVDSNVMRVSLMSFDADLRREMSKGNVIEVK
jgi:hypothetical protein